MTNVSPTGEVSLVDELPPSAWMDAGIEAPRNAIAVLGKKGGTGKTSFTELLLDAAVRLGLNALGIDGDPQANLSLALNNRVTMVDSGRVGMGNRKVLEPDRFTLVEILDADEDGVVDQGFELGGWTYDPKADFTQGGPLIPGQLGTLGIIPAHNALEDATRNWSMSDVGRLDRALNAPLEPGGIIPRVRWDLVFTDMLPGGSDLARAQLKAMTGFIVLTTAEPFGINAITDTLKFGRDIQDNWGNPGLNPMGLVFTSYSPKSVVSKTELGDLRDAQRAGNKDVAIEQWAPFVPTRTVVPTAQGYRIPVSTMLTQARYREAAAEMCQVGEAVVLRILREIGHPRADELRERWEAAWPNLSDWATGKISERER